MTIQEIRESGKQYLTPNDVAPVLQCKPYTLNVTVKCGGTLPFPYLMLGTRLKIPARPFLAYVEAMGLEDRA